MHKKFATLIQLSCFFVFFGRAYELIFFGAPFRAFLWDEALMLPFVQGTFNTSWNDYASSIKVNNAIDNFAIAVGFLFLLNSIMVLFWKKIRYIKVKRVLIGLGLLFLLILGICVAKDKRNDPFQFIEMSLQFCAPLLFLYSFSSKKTSLSSLNIFMKIALALTFIPHGLYALGAIYLPGHFIDMTIKILSVSESEAKVFLYVVGLLDVIFAIAIFIPNSLNKYILLYLSFWGITTAFARIVFSISADFILGTIHNAAFLTLYRLPHGLIPLAIFLIEKHLNTNKANHYESKINLKNIFSFNYR